MRSVRWWGVGLAVAVAAVAVLLLQQGGSGGPLNAIAAAAEATEHEPGGRTTTVVIVTLPDGTKTTMAGKSVFDDTGRSGGFLRVRDPKSGKPVKFSFVGDGSTMYVSSSEFGSLPGGARWMGLELAPGEESKGPVPASSDVTQGLKLLEAVDGVEEVGKEPVRGVATTRYRGTTGPSGRPMPVEVWIDAAGRIRRMRLINSGVNDKGERSAKLDMRTDFFDFGSTPKVEVPDPGEVFNATSLIESGSAG